VIDMAASSRRPVGDHQDGIVLGLVGSLLVMTVAIVLIPTRDRLGPTNIALVLCVVVVSLAALGGRYAGVITGFVGALSFDFWHVQPYGTLRIDQGRDIAVVVLLMVIGAIVGELYALRRRSLVDRADTRALLEHVLRVAHLSATGAPTDAVWQQIRTELVDMFHLDDCRFETPDQATRPLVRIDPAGGMPRQFLHRFLGRGFELPPEGAEIVVQHDTDVYGRIVLIPGESEGATVAERRVAVGLAEQLGLAMSLHAPQ
jgi:hypothetical protein